MAMFRHGDKAELGPVRSHTSSGSGVCMFICGVPAVVIPCPRVSSLNVSDVFVLPAFATIAWHGQDVGRLLPDAQGVMLQLPRPARLDYLLVLCASGCLPTRPALF